MACSSELLKVTGMRRVDDGEPIIPPKPRFKGIKSIDPIIGPTPRPQPPPPQVVICFISISLPSEVQVALSKGCDIIFLEP